MSKIEGIKYVAPIADGSGYAKAARGYVLALRKLGVPITVAPISFEETHPDLGEDGDIIKGLINKKIDYNVIFIHTTPEFWSTYRESDKTNIGFTIWETTKLHKDWPGYINNNVDKVIVGCEWNVDVFKDSGVTIPIASVPHTIPVDDFDHIEPYDIAGISKDTYVFGFVAQWCYDDKTKVFTKDGLKYFKDLTYDDYIATFNLETELTEYHKPIKIVSFDRKGPMIKVSGKDFDMCVTPDHRMVVKDITNDKGWVLLPFNNIIKKRKNGSLYVPEKYVFRTNTAELTMTYAKVEEIYYEGKVYCATVVNHNMLVERNDKIIFSGNTERKDPLSLLKAYWYAFHNNEDVALVLKTYRSNYSEKEKDAIRITIKRLKSMTIFDRYPKIYYISNMLSEDEMRGLYKRIDCYVSLDRGEGFGLSPFIAGSYGKPVIATGFGGVTEYLKRDNSYLLNYTLAPTHSMTWTKWYTGEQLWAQADILDGANKMRDVYYNREKARYRGEMLKKYIHDNFNDEVIGKKMIKEIELVL